MNITVELSLLLLLILANGLFSMSEIAVLSARKIRLQQRADEGDNGAKKALELAESSGNFLSTVQIGITLVGILAGAFGGATLTEELTIWFATIPVIEPYSESISFVLVVLLITYLSLVIGELVPKNIALSDPERIATAVSPFMSRLSRVTYPVVRLLTLSTDSIIRLLGIRPSTEPAFTEQEIQSMLDQGAEVGLFEPEEPEIVRRVFRLADRKVSSLMTPRREIIWLDVSDSPETIQQTVMENNYGRFPVADGDLDSVIGLVQTRDLMAHCLTGHGWELQSILQQPLYVPESMDILDLLARFREHRTHIALIIDEYGGLEGLVTMNDILEAIVGDVPVAGEATEPDIVQRADGSWLLDGMLPVEELRELLEITELPEGESNYYQTVGGLMMTMLERLPSSGDYFDWQGYRFEVMDMDGLRVDKVMVSQPKETT